MIWMAVAAMNVVCFCMMGIDKLKAKRGAWRIPEKTLFLAAALFGALGGVVGMQVFRHKTRHLKFQLGFSVLMVIQIVLLALCVLR